MNSKRLDIASFLFVPLGVFSIWAALFQLPHHAHDKSWPFHARFHVTWASGKLLALGVNQILLAIIPFRSRQRWSWFAMACNFLFGGLVIVPASRTHMGPLGPFQLHDTSTKMVLMSWLATVLGLVIGFQELFLHGAPPARRQE